jgi:hypothetical protein
MDCGSFCELKKLSAKWHEEIALLREKASQTAIAHDRYGLTVMANTYVVCASALDEFLEQDSADEKPRAKAAHA